MNSTENAHAYRERIYGAYVSGRQQALAPESLEGLKSRLPYLRWMVRNCLPLPKDAQIVDLGCGHGAILHALRLEDFRNVSGIDGSPEQVRAAKRLGIEGVRQGDLMKYLHQAADESLDAVITFDVIEHFTREELIPLVDAIHRVLRPGGYWLIHVPNGESPFGGSVRYGDLTHELAFSRASLGQLLLSSGFAQVKTWEDRPVPHGVKSTIRAFLWQVIRAGWMFYNAVETGSVDRGAIFSRNLLAVAKKNHS